MRALLFIFFAASLFAEEENGNLSHFNITNHTMQLESGPLNYTAITGTLPLINDEGEITAEIFFIGYKKDGEQDRPVTFFFPGGPGGAATYKSIATFGPRRILTAGEGRTTLPPYKFIDNPETLLEFTDLVFVDPVNCGFSRATEHAELSYFYSVDGDINSLGEFVRTFVATFECWNCPKYLAGGSYGTPRCCGLALNLLHYDIVVSGVILHGCALDFSALQSERDRALGDLLLIPTFAATAWYHDRLWPEKSLSEVIDYARRFAYDEYAPVMLQPTRLSPFEKEAFYQRLSELIGLPIATIQRYNGRIDEMTYCSEFFAPERKRLGGKDTRYIGDVSFIDPDEDFDPSYLDSLGIECAFNVYLQKELETSYPLNEYIGFSREALYNWRFSTYDSRGEPNLFQRLRLALTINPLLKVFVGSGYYDSRTPFAATEYTFDHLDLPISYKENLQFEYYEAGHGFILDYPSLKKIKQDLVRFYGKTP